MTQVDQFHALQQQMGALPLDPARLAPVSTLGGPHAARFGGAAEEYRAAQEDCVLFDLSDRSQIELSGRDARSFLHNFCTNDIKRRQPGTGCELFLTNAKGRILTHGFAFVADDSVWLDLPQGHESAIVNHLERYHFSEAVNIRGRTDEFGDLYLAGVQSLARLSALGLACESLANCDHALCSWREQPVVVRRVDIWHVPGVLLSIERSRLPELWQALVTCGVTPAGAEAFHACRILGGFPLSGVDVNEDHLAQEADRTKQAISFTKGCYLGQEPIARLDALGHVNRQLCRVRLECLHAPSAGCALVDHESRPLGSISSSVLFPDDSHAVALAMVRTSHSATGSTLTLLEAEQQIPARVL